MHDMKRSQLGPFSLDEILSVAASILREPERRNDFADQAKGILAARRERARKARLQGGSENDGEAGRRPPSWNEFVLATADVEDREIDPGPDGTPDHFARYLPFVPGERGSGIYFLVRNLVGAAAASPGLGFRDFLGAVATHELFHYYVDRIAMPRPGAGGFGCSCGSYCEVEEAAANYLARERAAGKDKSLAAFDDLLFLPRSRGGLPGYGDYSQLDGRITSFIPYLKAEGGRGCVVPAGYPEAAAKLSSDPRFAGSFGAALWEAALANARRGEVAFYLDMRE